jgi:hypothetical protein
MYKPCSINNITGRKDRLKKTASLLVITLFMMLLLSFYNINLRVRANNTPLISFSKSQYIVGVNKPFNVTLMVTDVTDLDGYEVGIFFDPTMLQYITVTAPSDNVFGSKLIFNGGIVHDYDSPNRTTVTVGAAAFPSIPSFSGSGILATVTFVMKATGTTALAYDLNTLSPGWHEFTFLLDSRINEMAYQTSTCTIKAVQSMCDVNNDGIVNMKDIVTAVMSFNSFPGTPRWNPYADVDDNGRVDLKDICLIVSNFGMNTSGTPSGGIPGIEDLQFLNIYANRTTDGWVAHMIIKNAGTTTITFDNSTIDIMGSPPSDYSPYAPIENIGQATLQIGETMDLQFVLPGGSGSPWQTGSQFGIGINTVAGHRYVTYFDMILYLP